MGKGTRFVRIEAYRLLKITNSVSAKEEYEKNRDV